MRLDIYQANEEKLLKDANALKMSPTEFVNWLIETLELTPPTIKKIKIDVESPKINFKKKSNFVKNW